MTLGIVRKTAFCVWFVPAIFLFAADDSEPLIRRLSFGVRAEAFPLRLFNIHDFATSTTQPIADYTYSASSSSSKVGLGPTVEYRWTNRWSFGVEVNFHHADYQGTIVELSGLPGNNSPTDNRVPTTTTDTTQANYWDVPILARYYGLPKPQSWLVRRIPRTLFDRAYVVGGLEFQHVGRVRTGNAVSNADGTTAYNEISDKPHLGNQPGLVVGIGLRFMDEFHIKVMPEVRFVRWEGSTFEGPSYHSVVNQLEGGLGLSF
jgi:hypothetical protein